MALWLYLIPERSTVTVVQICNLPLALVFNLFAAQGRATQTLQSTTAKATRERTVTALTPG